MNKNINKLTNYFEQNSDKVYKIFGQLFVVALFFAAVVGIIVWIMRSLSQIPGFRFDPYLIITVAVIGFFHLRLQQNRNKILQEISSKLEANPKQKALPLQKTLSTSLAIKRTKALAKKKNSRAS